MTEFVAPASLLSVGDEAFADCLRLEKVILPETIFQVGEKILENSPLSVLEYKKWTILVNVFLWQKLDIIPKKIIIEL